MFSGSSYSIKLLGMLSDLTGSEKFKMLPSKTGIHGLEADLMEYLSRLGAEIYLRTVG